MLPFQLTTESWRKSSPLTVSRNCFPPAVALLGEIEVTDGRGGHVPHDTAVHSTIASTAKTGDLAIVAKGLCLRQTGERQARFKAGIRRSVGLAEPHISSVRYHNYTSKVETSFSRCPVQDVTALNLCRSPRESLVACQAIPVVDPGRKPGTDGVFPSFLTNGDRHRPVSPRFQTADIFLRLGGAAPSALRYSGKNDERLQPLLRYPPWPLPAAAIPDVAAITQLLKPYDARLMRCYPVSTRINHVANDDEQCSQTVELAETQNRLFLYPPARLLILCRDCLRLLLSHLQLCLQPIIEFVPLVSPALLVQSVGATTDLLLEVRCGFRHLGWCLTWSGCGAGGFHCSVLL
jgi:hypothetical protein